jgi:hypothetical protein
MTCALTLVLATVKNHRKAQLMENNTGNVTISPLMKIFGSLKVKVTFEIEKEPFELT